MVQKILYVYRFASLVYHKGFFSNDILKNYILLNISLDHQSRVCEIKSVNRHSMISDGAVSS